MNFVLQRLAQGYDEQTPQYEKMYKLVLEQEKVLQEKEVDTSTLLDLIAKRQGIIEILEEQNEKLSDLKGEVCTSLELNEFSIKEIKARMGGDGVEALSASLARLSEVIGKIKGHDRENEKTLRQRIKETAGHLAGIHKQKKARKAYTEEPRCEDGVFIDYSK